ncbi:MAG: response regulator [Candidatus Manganitrophaceae bacterium]|nr:MAG: response regulator [Candidatus Manganitrophaceae bacterium]
MVIDAIEILLVEDNPDHAELTRRALEDTRLLNQIYWVKDGQEALDFLFRKGRHAQAARPGLILLDINLPKISGMEVLKKIKEDEALRVIPVIMLTTSNQDEEALSCYNLGANSFTTKPVKFRDFMEKVRSLKLFWVLTNKTLKSFEV